MQAYNQRNYSTIFSTKNRQNKKEILGKHELKIKLTHFTLSDNITDKTKDKSTKVESTEL